MGDLSQIAISLLYLTSHKKGWSGHKQLEQLLCCYAAPREAWKLVGQLHLIRLCNPSSTVLKRVYDKLFTTAATDVVCHTACASHTRCLRDKNAHPDLLRWSSHSSSPPSCTPDWCWTSLPERILQWTQNPELSGHEREVAVLTGLMKNQSKCILRSALWIDWKLNFQLEQAEMQLIGYYPLQMQNFLKKAVERMVSPNWLNITCSAVLFFPTTGICHSMCQSGQLWYFSQRALHSAHRLNPDNCKKLSQSSSLSSS